MSFEIIDIDNINNMKARFRGFSSVEEAVETIMTAFLRTHLTLKDVYAMKQNGEKVENKIMKWVVEGKAYNGKDDCLLEIDPAISLEKLGKLISGELPLCPDKCDIWPLFPVNDYTHTPHGPRTLLHLRSYLASGSHINPCWYDRASSTIYATTTAQEDSKEQYECYLTPREPFLSAEEIATFAANVPEDGTLTGTYFRGNFETTVYDKTEVHGTQGTYVPTECIRVSPDGFFQVYKFENNKLVPCGDKKPMKELYSKN